MDNINSITGISTRNDMYTAYAALEINGIDADSKTYISSECKTGAVKDLLKNIRTDNVYNIKSASIKRKGDRSHFAKYFRIPVIDIVRVYNWEEAYNISEKTGMEIYTQRDGHEYLLVDRQSYIIIARLYILSHEIADNTLPYYFDRSGNKVSEISFRYDMFFSDYQQAYYKKQHIYDFANIVEIFTAPENDARADLEKVY